MVVMQMNYRSSTAQNRIDCRSLSLHFEYYELTKKQILVMFEETASFLRGILAGQCVSKHLVCERSVREDRLIQAATNAMTDKGYLTYSMQAYVKNQIVHNWETMQSYAKRLVHALNCSNDSIMSEDYLQYWRELFPSRPEDPQMIKKGILQIFHQKGKYCIGLYPTSDIQACFIAAPYNKEHSLYHGFFRLDFCAYCLDDNLLTMAEQLCHLAMSHYLQYRHLNARVLLQPLVIGNEGAHKQYFRGDRRLDGSHIQNNCTPAEWYSTYYLEGCEWLNIIAPRSCEHLAKSRKPQDPSVLIQDLMGGGIMVQSAKTILEYDVDDALRIKEYLYPALYPGSSRVALRELFGPENDFAFSYPRPKWEIVPILDDEIKIVGREMFYSSLV